MRPKAQGVVLYDAQLLACLVDELAQFPRPVDDISALVLILGPNGLPDLLVLPGRSEVELPPSLKLLLGLDEWVEDPLPVLDGDIGPERPGSLIEGMHLFLGELAIEDFKLLPT